MSRRRHPTLFVIVAITTATSFRAHLVPPIQANEFSFQGIGDLPGGDYSSAAHSVSADGRVVTGESNAANGAKAIRWTKAEGLSSIGDAPGFGNSNGWGVSGDGSVIVGNVNQLNGLGLAFKWTQETGMVALPGAGSGLNVSADGNVVVGTTNIEGSILAVQWRPERTIIPGGAIANDVSADGSVIVGWGGSFRWTAATGTVSPLFSEGGSAEGISPDGSVVVGTMGGDIWGGRAFRWTEEGGVVPIGSAQSTAYAASNYGDVIVGSTGGSRGQLLNAHLWGPGNTYLAQALALNGIAAMGGWTDTVALDVSADGRTIVGYGKNPDGKLEGWVATIPLIGDASFDGIVDGADYTYWADHFLSTNANWGVGDFNFDGHVDGADYTLWGDHFAPFALRVAAVPEPSTHGLLVTGILALLANWLRRRNFSIRGH